MRHWKVARALNYLIGSIRNWYKLYRVEKVILSFDPGDNESCQ